MTKSILERREKRFAIIFYLLSFIFLWTPISQAETEADQKKNEVLAIGAGTVVKGNSALAKKKAVTQALKKGVENYITTFVGAQAAVNSFERLTEEIIPGAEEAVENFHILAEHQIGDRYMVLIKLRVNEEVIGERLRSADVVLTEAPPIKVLFLVSETSKGHTSYWWRGEDTLQELTAFELTLHKAFQDRGFSLINRIMNPPNVEQIRDLKSPELADHHILRLGTLLGADVVVLGQGVIGGEELTLTLRALDVQGGKEICRTFRVEPVEPLEQEQLAGDRLLEALREPVNRLTASLCPCIIRAVSKQHAEVRHLEVTLTGMTRPGQFWSFRDFLKNEITGVESVIPSRIEGDSVSATVAFQGDGETFVNRVMGHENPPFPLHAVQTEEGKLVFSLDYRVSDNDFGKARGRNRSKSYP